MVSEFLDKYNDVMITFTTHELYVGMLEDKKISNIELVYKDITKLSEDTVNALIEVFTAILDKDTDICREMYPTNLIRFVEEACEGLKLYYKYNTHE